MTSLTPSTPSSAHTGGLTPTGLQSLNGLTRRRLLVLALGLATMAVLCAMLAIVLRAGGWGMLESLMMACFVMIAPWNVLGFWNAAIGLWLLHGMRDGLARTAPFALAGNHPAPLVSKTAIAMTIRNEDAARAITRLMVIRHSVMDTGQGDGFSFYILSDTSEPSVAASEEAQISAWKASVAQQEGQEHADRIVYRRRDHNEGFKAGNLHSFCEQYRQGHEFMVLLDADSLMSGEAIVRLVAIGEAHPEIGIVQSLVVGAPARSGFARIFQFGMRHGMRPYTFGSAWWAGDCGPFWGHNALVRIAPFHAYCALPVLPGKPPFGGPILSHDQVEAALMRRAGYEVRVLPIEGGSYEDNPPDLTEFSNRDRRWCQGNMQYFPLIGLPGLKPMSRYQLAWAMLMFAGLPASLLFMILCIIKAAMLPPNAVFPAGLAMGLYGLFLFMQLFPKLAGFADIALTPGALRTYGGGWMFACGALCEIVFSLLLAAIMGFRTGLFMLGLFFGRAIGWRAQARDASGLAWHRAFQLLWPAMLFGWAYFAALSLFAPGLMSWAMPYLAGLMVAAPFAVITASLSFGQALSKAGLCAIPEERDPPAILAAFAEQKP